MTRLHWHRTPTGWVVWDPSTGRTATSSVLTTAGGWVVHTSGDRWGHRSGGRQHFPDRSKAHIAAALWVAYARPLR